MPASVHDTITGGLKTLVETLSGEPTVVVRDEMVRMEGDALPLIVITKGQERLVGRGTGGALVREYDTFLTFLAAQNFVFESGIGDMDGWRDSVRRRLEPDGTVSPPILPGAAMVYDIECEELPADDTRAKAAGYERAQLGVVCRTGEAAHA
jgi:hypothetical protein